jgi:hypothetical protein
MKTEQLDFLLDIFSNDRVSYNDGEKVVISRIDFRNTDFKDRDIEDMHFSFCNFDLSDFSNSIIKNCTFQDCDLSNSMFCNTSIESCAFSNCSMHSCNFSSADFDDCELTYSDIRGSGFEEAKFTKTSFRHMKGKLSGLLTNEQIVAVTSLDPDKLLFLDYLIEGESGVDAEGRFIFRSKDKFNSNYIKYEKPAKCINFITVDKPDMVRFIIMVIQSLMKLDDKFDKNAIADSIKRIYCEEGAKSYEKIMAEFGEYLKFEFPEGN